jgi:signal transduction histidine kinase
LLGLVCGVVITAIYKYFVILRKEAVLEESYKTLSEFLQNLTEGVALLDSNDNLVASNVVARNAVTGTTDLTFDQLEDTLTEHLDFRDVCEQVRKNGGKESVRDIKLEDGTYYQLIFSAINPEDADVLSDGGIIIVFHDMTEEKELARVREDFTSMMVHELRSPLDAVKKMSNHLHEREVTEEKKEKYLSLISNNASQVLTLVNDLLDVSKIEAGKFELRKEPTDIKKLVSNRVDFYEPLSENRGLSWEVAEDVPERITLDPDRINQVMNNILSNAIKFTNETEGKVSVHVAAKQPQELAEVNSKEVHWFDSGEAEIMDTDYIIIDIGDNGAGIPEEDINELFDKFKQFEAAAKTEKAGTGLGLAIVKGITEQHGGVIGVASQEGEGTHFLIALPVGSD